ncbi:MAG: YraN family protein [Oscillospiraceae bacterium]|nr:YraN family protein [Oscillospiraceae bacterium]
MAKLSESKKLIGQWGEDQACEYLRRHGYRIIGRNYSCRFGEVDVIACRRGYLAFVEVKLRRSDRFAAAREFVDARKQERLRSAASLWLAENETDLQPRFDVIEIYGEPGMAYRSLQIHHYENAFE